MRIRFIMICVVFPKIILNLKLKYLNTYNVGTIQVYGQFENYNFNFREVRESSFVHKVNNHNIIFILFLLINYL